MIGPTMMPEDAVGGSFVGAYLIGWQATRHQVADPIDSETNIRHSNQLLGLVFSPISTMRQGRPDQSYQRNPAAPNGLAREADSSQWGA
jgi:hypothetical protein